MWKTNFCGLIFGDHQVEYIVIVSLPSSPIRVILAGHCSDGVTGQPTQGLQFVLGTQEQQDIFDTIVMANLVSMYQYSSIYMIIAAYSETGKHLAGLLLQSFGDKKIGWIDPVAREIGYSLHNIVIVA